MSASWAILHTSNSSSPHLSPVSSEASLVDGAEEGNSVLENSAFNDTQSSTFLEEGQSSTVIEAPTGEQATGEEPAEQTSGIEMKGLSTWFLFVKII